MEFHSFSFPFKYQKQEKWNVYLTPTGKCEHICFGDHNFLVAAWILAMLLSRLTTDL